MTDPYLSRGELTANLNARITRCAYNFVRPTPRSYTPSATQPCFSLPLRLPPPRSQRIDPIPIPAYGVARPPKKKRITAYGRDDALTRDAVIEVDLVIA